MNPPGVFDDMTSTFLSRKSQVSGHAGGIQTVIGPLIGLTPDSAHTLCTAHLHNPDTHHHN